MRFCLESRTIAELKVNVVVHEQKKKAYICRKPRIGLAKKPIKLSQAQCNAVNKILDRALKQAGL